MASGNISEIFHSIQGEGAYCGHPFLFVRLSGCNLRCSYCDTPASLGKTNEAKIFSDSLSDSRVEIVDNPISSEDILSILKNYQYRNITFTGGEPLLQSVFLESVLPFLKDKFILMETNGTLYEHVTPVITEAVSHWSVDIKLKSASGESCFPQHRLFLEKTKLANSLSLKAVFTPQTTKEEIEKTIRLSEEFQNGRKDYQLIFQPITVEGRPVLGNNLETIFSLIKQSDVPIRLIPQQHPMMKIP